MLTNYNLSHFISVYNASGGSGGFRGFKLLRIYIKVEDFSYSFLNIFRVLE